MDQMYVTVREAAAVWGLSLKTVQTWINRRILVPEVTAPPRSPRGHQLSVADVVVLGLLHALFNIGVKFDDVPRLPASNFSFDTEGFSEVMNTELERQADKGRMIQAYLELLNPRCECFMHRISWQVLAAGKESIQSHIRFVRQKNIPRILDDLMSSKGLKGHFMVNVGSIHQYVLKRIKESA
ncbi:MAG: hypothetical protein ACLP5H_31510 [Desulfomonilaceae bacterium]